MCDPVEEDWWLAAGLILRGRFIKVWAVCLVVRGRFKVVSCVRQYWWAVCLIVRGCLIVKGKELFEAIFFVDTGYSSVLVGVCV